MCLAFTLVVITASFLVLSALRPPFTVHEKAYYADANLINFVRPGLVVKIVSAEISAEGVIRARFRLADP